MPPRRQPAAEADVRPEEVPLPPDVPARNTRGATANSEPAPDPALPNLPDENLEEDPELKKMATVLATAIESAFRISGTGESTVRHRAPEAFSGTDPHKLRNFLAQCELNFLASPNKFKTDQKKVLYAFSYLSDGALEWFEQKFADYKNSDEGNSASQAGGSQDSEDDEEEAAAYITAMRHIRSGAKFRRHTWVTSWEAFVYEISTNFGPADDEGDAERQLTSLSMSSDKHIIWYNLRFNRYSARTSWDDRALSFRYYEGLPERLQDAITSEGKPRILSAMKAMALKWDQRYWERQGEKRRNSEKEKKPQKSSSSSSTYNSSTFQNNSASTSSFSNSARNNRTQRSSTPRNHNSAPSASSASASSASTNSLSDKLGSDGKLTAAERTRRVAMNLCLFCGLPGHRAKDCRKAMKARASKADAPKPSSEGTSGKA